MAKFTTLSTKKFVRSLKNSEYYSMHSSSRIQEKFIINETLEGAKWLSPNKGPDGYFIETGEKIEIKCMSFWKGETSETLDAKRARAGRLPYGSISLKNLKTKIESNEHTYQANFINGQLISRTYFRFETIRESYSKIINNKTNYISFEIYKDIAEVEFFVDDIDPFKDIFDDNYFEWLKLKKSELTSKSNSSLSLNGYNNSNLKQKGLKMLNVSSKFSSVRKYVSSVASALLGKTKVASPLKEDKVALKIKAITPALGERVKVNHAEAIDFNGEVFNKGSWRLKTIFEQNYKGCSYFGHNTYKILFKNEEGEFKTKSLSTVKDAEARRIKEVRLKEILSQIVSGDNIPKGIVANFNKYYPNCTLKSFNLKTKKLSYSRGSSYKIKEINLATLNNRKYI